MPPTRLATRLGITHGALVVVLAVVLVVTLQGLVRMLGVMTVIRDQRLTSLDAEEELHHAAWQVETALRHGRYACADDKAEASFTFRDRLVKARAGFREVSARTGTDVAPALREAAARYGTFADDALAGNSCAFLLLPSTDERRLSLDEDLTDAWIDRLHDVHTDIERKEGRRATSAGARRGAPSSLPPSARSPPSSSRAGRRQASRGRSRVSPPPRDASGKGNSRPSRRLAGRRRWKRCGSISNARARSSSVSTE